MKIKKIGGIIPLKQSYTETEMFLLNQNQQAGGIPNNPILYYKFDNNFIDSSSSNANLTPVIRIGSGVPIIFQTGRDGITPNRSVRFNNDIAKSTSLNGNFSTVNSFNGFTMSFWTKKNQNEPNVAFLCTIGNLSYALSSAFASIPWTAVLYLGVGSEIQIFAIGVWQHHVITMGVDRLMDYYLDNVKIKDAIPLGVDFKNTNPSIMFGWGAGNYPLDANIQDFRLYNYKLNSEQITALFEE